MEFAGLLLRKATLNDDVPLKVTQSCVRELRRCYGGVCKDMDDEVLIELIREKIRISITNKHVFENPKKTSQLIAYAEVWGTSCWFIISDEKDGGLRLVITMRMHRDRDFGEELSQIKEEE
jgi:hypothetical protein